MIEFEHLKERESEVINGTSLVRDLAKLRGKVSPELRVLCDAVAYLVVAVDHLLLHAHDDEPIEH